MNQLKASIILFLPIIGLLALAWQFGVSPQLERIERAKTELASLEQERSVLEKQISSQRSTKGNQNQFDPTDIWGQATSQGVAHSIQVVSVNLAKTSGLALERFGQARQRNGTGAPVAALELELSGNLSGLVKFLHLVETSKPRLAIRALRLRPNPSRPKQGGETQIAIQMTLWGIVGADVQ